MESVLDIGIIFATIKIWKVHFPWEGGYFEKSIGRITKTKRY